MPQVKRRATSHLVNLRRAMCQTAREDGSKHRLNWEWRTTPLRRTRE
jgi:hypothetical protein